MSLEDVLIAAVNAGVRVTITFEPHNSRRIEHLAQKSGLPESNCEEDILETLRTAGHRLTTMQLLEALSREERLHGESTVKTHLASMVRRQLLTKDPDANPHGYGLPEWLTNGNGKH